MAEATRGLVCLPPHPEGVSAMSARELLRRLRRNIENSRTPIGRAAYWLRTHTVDRYHIVDIRSPRNGYAWGWIDRSEVMLFAAFAVLADFMENEYPGCVDWNHSPEMREQHLELLALNRWWTVDRAPARDADDGTTDAMDDKDQAMLLRLMAVRGILWT